MTDDDARRMKTLAGQNDIVTGSSYGIGAEIAKRLAPVGGLFSEIDDDNNTG